MLSVGLLLLLVACGSTPTPTVAARSTAITGATVPVDSGAASMASTASPAASSPSTVAVPAVPPRPSATVATIRPTTAITPAGPTLAPGTGPVIVIDPGHSPTIYAIDPTTGLNVSDYENEPEMQNVFVVAQLVRSQLLAAGYQVVMTKNTPTDRVSLAQRAAVANNAHATLAISIHDQAGASGGIGFRQGNSTVYYQSVGTYRVSTNGTRITFTDAAVAATSQRFGQIFAAQRAAAQGNSVRLLGNVGYDLGSRGLPAGNIWMVQLLSTVPWIYNEAGGNSAGLVGLSGADEQTYARGLVAAIEGCVPVGG